MKRKRLNRKGYQVGVRRSSKAPSTTLKDQTICLEISRVHLMHKHHLFVLMRITWKTTPSESSLMICTYAEWRCWQYPDYIDYYIPHKRIPERHRWWILYHYFNMLHYIETTLLQNDINFYKGPFTGTELYQGYKRKEIILARKPEMCILLIFCIFRQDNWMEYLGHSYHTLNDVFGINKRKKSIPEKSY